MSAAKAELRATILAARRALPAHEHDAEAHALTRHSTTFIKPDETVCAYVPVGSEPGSIELIDSLHRRGVRVLLPVARYD
ncbi:UNVERIFIED_CONTAM: 5-formyltetrahydrofolate cyclo-ligase, partial [Bacillus amyloliquefaciens DSM 7 = ATCC 23350]